MKNTIKNLAVFMTAALLLTGCGSSSSATSYAVDSAAYDTEGIASTESYDYSRSSNEVYSESDSEITGEKLVYTGSISIETLEYDTTVSNISTYIKSYNGIVESQNENNYQYRWYDDDSVGNRYFYMTVRIPTESFDDFFAELEGTGHVTSKSQNVENITKQYNNNAIEIESLQTQETRLLEMLEQAETVEDMITIDARLSEVETELRQLQNAQSQMDTDVEYSTITISIEEVQKYTEVNYERFDISGFTERLKEAFHTSWTFFVWVFQEALLVLIVVFPVGIVVYFLVKGIRKLFRKRKEKKSAKQESEVK